MQMKVDSQYCYDLGGRLAMLKTQEEMDAFEYYNGPGSEWKHFAVAGHDD